MTRLLIILLGIGVIALAVSLAASTPDRGSAAEHEDASLAIDLVDVTGNSPTFVSLPVNDCGEVASGESYDLDVTVYAGGIRSGDAVAFQLDLNFAGTVASRDTFTVSGTEFLVDSGFASQSIINEESPDVGGTGVVVTGASDSVPDSTTPHTILASNDAAVGSGGASSLTGGKLLGLNMTAPVVGTPTLFTLSLSNTSLDNSSGGSIAHHTHAATLEVGGTIDGLCGGVGGIAEVLVDSPDSPASPADGSSSSVGGTAAIAGAVATGVLALAAGGWYARRRWLR